MGKAYLKYEQIAGFGVVSSSTAPVKQVRCSKSSTPFFASAAVDILTIWNGRTGEAVARYANAATRKAGAITALVVSSAGDTIACGYSDGSIRLWIFSVRDIQAFSSAMATAGGGGGGGGDDDDDSNNVPCVFSMHGNEPNPALTFNGHRSGISALAFEDESPPSSSSSAMTAAAVPTTLVSGSNDGDIILWNVLESHGVFRINAHSDAITSIALFGFERNTYIVSASKDTLVKVFDKDTQHCIQTIAQSHAEVWALHMDVSTRLLFVGSVGTEIRMYSLMTSEEQRAQQQQRMQQRKKNSNNDSEDDDDDSDQLTTVDDLLSYDNESIFKPLGFVERSVAMDRVSTIESVMYKGERYVVMCAADKTAEIFRLRDDAQAQIHRRRREKRKMAAIERDVKGLGEDEAWDAARIEQTIKEQQAEIQFSVEAIDYMISIRQLRMRKKLRSVVFLSSSTYIASETNDVGGIELQLLVQLKDNALEIHSVTISSSKKNKKRKKIATDDHHVDDDLSKKEEAGGNEIKKIVAMDFAGHRNDVRSVALSPEESTLLSTSDGALKLWNVATQKCIRTMSFSGYGLSTLFVGADGMLGVVGTKTGSVEVYELGSGAALTREEEAHTGEVWSMCLDDHIYDATTLVTGGADKRVCFWGLENVLSGRRRRRQPSSSLASASDGKNDDPSDDDDGFKLNLTRVLEMTDQVLCVRVAYQRKRPVVLVSLMDCSVRAFFLDSLDPYLNFYGHRLPVMSMDVSSDGLLLATGSADKTLKVWGMDFGDCRRSLRAHDDSVLCAAFQPKTHYVFSGSRDGAVKYWDADNFELICELEGQRGEVWALVVSLDGEVVASASHDRMIRVWRRTDEPLFLDEEKDRRLDDMFEAKLIEDDILQASKSRKDDLAIHNKGERPNGEEERNNVGFMYDDGKAEASAAGKQSMDTIKGSEAIMEAVELCDAEKQALAEQEEEGEQDEGNTNGAGDNNNTNQDMMAMIMNPKKMKMNPLLLGMSPDMYMLRCLERVRHADLEQTLQMLPLHVAVRLFDYLCILLDPSCQAATLSVEHLARIGLFLVRYHHAQMCAGALPRATLARFQRVVMERCQAVRNRFAMNQAALHFCAGQLALHDDRPFRDARARAFNIELGHRNKRGRKNPSR